MERVTAAQTGHSVTGGQAGKGEGAVCEGNVLPGHSTLTAISFIGFPLGSALLAALVSPNV